MKRNILLSLLLVFVVVLVTFFFFRLKAQLANGSIPAESAASSTANLVAATSSSSSMSNDKVETASAPQNVQSTGTTTVVYQPQVSFDPSNIEQLVANSSKVFVGTVEKEEANVQTNHGDSPSFWVQGVMNIKGDSDGGSLVVQSDIAYQNDEKVYIAAGDTENSASPNPDDGLLKVGYTYLFAIASTSSVPGTIFFPPYDRVLITSVSTSTLNLQSIIDQNQTYQQFVQATATLGETYHFQEDFQ